MKRKTEHKAICAICHKLINLDKDSYVVVEDYKSGFFFMKQYYHNKCYNERVNSGLTMMQKAVYGLMQQSKKALGDMGYKDKDDEIEFIPEKR